MSKALIDNLSQPEARRFLLDHLDDDPAALMLQKAKHPNLPLQDIVGQIQSRKKAQIKLPEWHAKEDIIFPVGVSMEQCSSEPTARYKASLVSGQSVTDLTGGFGIDLYYLSKSFEQANYVEQSNDLTALAAYNFQKLKVKNITVINDVAEEYLNQEKSPSDLYYLDPARRDDSNQKVFQIEDCTPDLSAILPVIAKRRSTILIKMSPLLDIHQSLDVLPQVSEVHVVAVRNECKELLFKIEPKSSQTAVRTAVNITPQGMDRFVFTPEQEEKLPIFSEPLNYLYEPNAAIMKAGGFNAVANAFDLQKLHRNSHLYTSKTQVENFPGRAFEILAITVLNKKKLKKFLSNNQANITVRNYPMSVKEIRKKTGIQEGGDIYLFATTLMDQSFKVVVCKKV
ncbi:MAG: class I SAM-dependent methyltransferase [Reichenbachiella sp.]|uniref:class I SAM-dependent methyltransferase n=1 Tax=Reichenbachiella sp. TaxID=2184521 RepID=UPI003262EA9A